MAKIDFLALRSRCERYAWASHRADLGEYLCLLCRNHQGVPLYQLIEKAHLPLLVTLRLLLHRKLPLLIHSVMEAVRGNRSRQRISKRNLWSLMSLLPPRLLHPQYRRSRSMGPSFSATRPSKQPHSCRV